MLKIEVPYNTMSTRCHIIIKKAGTDSQYVYHHCDGYPEGVGRQLVKLLREYADTLKHNCWEPESIVSHLTQYSDAYEPDGCVHGDEEFIYHIDCDDRTLRCFRYLNDEVGDEAEIPGNIFDGSHVQLAKDGIECATPCLTCHKGTENAAVGTVGTDRYWDAYIKIVSAMTPEWGTVTLRDCDYATIASTAKRMLDQCVKTLFGEERNN